MRRQNSWLFTAPGGLIHLLHRRGMGPKPYAADDIQLWNDLPHPLHFLAEKLSQIIEARTQLKQAPILCGAVHSALEWPSSPCEIVSPRLEVKSLRTYAIEAWPHRTWLPLISISKFNEIDQDGLGHIRWQSGPLMAS
jgi:hypothetical protein